MKRALGAMVGTVMIGSTMAGCVPSGPSGIGGSPTTAAPVVTAPPTTAAPAPTNASAPVIASFVATTASAPSPLTTALRWSINDPGNDPMTCRLDLDGNGSYEVTINACTSDSSRTRTFNTVGSTTVVLSVTDGTFTTTSSLALSVGTASSDPYTVTLRLGGTMSGPQTAAFTSAATKWAGIVKTGQPDRTVTLLANACTSGTAPFSGTVDDLLIDAQIIPIDGAGGILGQAGPCLVRSGNGLPVYGIMQFDSADVAGLESSGQLSNTIVHEMGHILGIGTVWSGSVLSNPGTSNPTFTGAAAIGAWRELGGNGNVPVENSGGAGTVDSHWRESIFKTELMTGYLNSTNQLSVLTAASLADLGYGVDLAGADAYSLPALRAGSVQAEGTVGHDHDDFITILPMGSV